MKGVGLTGDRFTVRYGVLARHFGKDSGHDLPMEVWEQLPDALQKPFAISEYYTDEDKQQQKGYRIYTRLQLADGSHVMVSAEVKNAGRDVEVNAINTVFGRSVISDVHEKLVYVGNELTPEQQALLDGTTPHQYPDARGQGEEGVPSSEGKDSVSSGNGQGNVGENVIEMPMRRVKRKIEGQMVEVDEEDFEAVSPERTQDYLYNEVESGITREQADDFVSAKIAEREKVVKGIEARKPRKGASPAEIRVHKGKVEAELAEAVPHLEYWRSVAAARDAVKEREIAAANERYRQERAAKEEAKRAAEVQRKEDVETLQNAEQGDNRTSSRMAIPASSDGKVNTSSNSKQGNVNESKGKAQKAFSYFNGSMEELIGKSSDKTANDKKVVSVVSEQLRNDLSAQGLEIGEDYKHVVDVSGIRHTMKQHGHIKEKKRGQVPIEAKDFALIENVVSSYDDVVVEQKKSTPIIKYKKRLDDGTIVYVEEVRMGRGELALKTMYKQKGSSLTDENLQMPVSDTPVATSDLDASDGKVSTSSEKGKRKAQKKTSNGDKPAFVGLDAFTEQRMAEELEKSGYASLEDWEIEEPDAFVTVYDNVGKEYASYVSRLAEEGTLQEVYDKSSVKTQNKIRKEIEFAGFDYHDLLDTSPNRVKRQDYLEGGAKYARGTFLDGRVVEGEIVEQSPTSITILENGRRYTIKASDVLVRSNEPLSSDESLSAKIAAAEGEVDTNPSEGQKEAGNYKKGHIRIGAFDISIEQPKGSVRRGVDANGKAWESKMHNTYGYFRGTEGVDGDHIDVFVSNDIDGWNGQKVFVVDQYNPDGTFDEHKVMLGFNNAEDAKSDYLANYEKGWEDGRRLDVSATNLEDFEKWLASSHRKTKPFAEYKGVKREVDEVDAALKKELQDFIAQTDTMDRTAMDESGYDAKELFAPLLLDGKPSPLAVMTSVSDDINDPSVQIAVYDYSQEIDEKTNSGWQKWGNLADEYNAQAAEEDKGWERGDTALLGFRSVDAAVRFYDWVQHRDGVKLHRKGATDAALHAVDDQGNLVDGEGRLVTEKVGSIDELRDEDFTSPSRSVELPELDARVADAIGTGGKPVVIKKNIFERNAKAHGDLTAADSRDILKAALYTPTLYGQNQKTKRPYNWVLIKTRDAEGENRVVLLEVNENKDNVEIVHWHYVRDNALETIKRQAVREGGPILILPSEDSEEAGGLSSRTNNLSSEGKVSESSKKEQGFDGKNGVIRLQKGDDGVAARDAAYADAVARGDMETAERMLAEEAARKGYMMESDYQGTSAFNGAAPSENGYYESLEERKAAFDEEDFEGDWSLADELVHGIEMGSLDFRLSDRELNHADRSRREAIQNLRNVRARVNAGEKDVRITMYRSVPAGVVEGEFRNGDWVTPSRLYAEDNAAVHGGYPGWENGYRIIEQEVPIEDVWWDGNDIAEWGYDNGREEAYKNVANNRKSFSVTYDADGVLIPLSKRFDEGVSDVSYHKGDDVVVSAEDTALRDAVVELMRGAGIDVVVDSEEGQRVLDMENERVRWAMERKTFRSGRSIVFTRANPTTTLNALERGLKKEGVEVESHKARTGSRYAEFERGGVWYKVRSANHTKALSAGTTLDEVRGMSGIELTMDLKDGERPVYGVEVDLSLNEMGVEDLRALMDEVERFNGSSVDVLSKERVSGFVLPSSYLGDEFPLLSGFLDDEVLRSDEFKGRVKEAQAEVGAVREAYEKETGKPVLDEWLHLPFTASNGLKIEHLSDGFGRYVSLMPVGSALSHGIGRFGDAKKLRKEAFAEYQAAVAPYEARLMAWEESAPSLEEWLKGNEEMSRRWASAQEVLSRAVGEARLHKVGSEEDAEEVNARFNDELSGLTEANADKVVLSLGRPSGILLSAGVEDRPMKLYGNKVMKKMRKHGFALEELRDLPRAVADPVAVFNNYGEVGNRSILTELRTKQGNFLVSVDIGKDADIDFNIVRSVFGKGDNSIVDWINKGLATYINKKKALTFLSHQSAPIAATAANAELSSAAKVVKDFENPKLGVEKRRFFRTEDGKAYGFTVDGKVYLDPKMAGVETAVHEYTHLWADALRRVNPAEWRNVVELMKGTSVWDEVKRNYPELESEDEIADEVLAHYSGRRGAAKLRAALGEEMAGADGVFERAQVVSAFERVKRALARFWKGVADFLNVHFDSADEVADMVLGDLLRGRRLDGEGVSVSMVGRSLSAEEAKELVSMMEENAVPVRELELTRENWAAEFGADGVVQTPLGEVKMGEHQYEKLEQQGRRGKLGMVKPTLESPDVVIEDKSRAKVGEETERGSSYVFVKSFVNEEGKRQYFFTSVTVHRNNQEVVISNQEKTGKRISNLLQQGEIGWINEKYQPASETQGEEISLSQDNSWTDTSGDKNAVPLGVNLSETSSAAKVDKSSEKGKGEDIFSMAERIAEETKREQRARRNARYHREGGSVEYGQAVSRAAYEQRMASGAFQSREALQDSMLSLREAMDLILHEGKHGKGWRVEDVSDLENAYMGENRLSSVNSAEQEAFTRGMFKPMLGAVAKLAETEEERMVLTDYLMAKHGLERNRVMAEREGLKAYETYVKKHSESEKEVGEFVEKARGRDYSGLTALTGVDDVMGAEMEAGKMVAEFEEKHDAELVSALWEKIGLVNGATLRKTYESGLISRGLYDDIRGMYKYYIPLRGFAEQTSDEVYAYMAQGGGMFNAPIKKARGRKSKADDPFANMAMMADSAIAQGNRNVLVKQKMLNFVMNHPSDLVSVSELWVGLDEQSGEWRVVLPDDIGVDDGGDVVVSKLEAFEAKMEQRAAERPDLYMRVTDGADVPYRVAGDAKLHQHQVVVKRGGRDYVLTVNGNPRLAQALNGATNPDSNLSGVVGKIVGAMDTLKRWQSMVFTSLSPNFMVSNLLRDTIYSHTMVHAKEGSNYALAYHKNALRTTPVHMAVLIGRYKAGKLDMGKGLERAFSEFMLNGGETGYISIREIDAHKREVKKVLRRLNGGRKLLGAWDDFLEGLDFFNRSVEIGSRFAAYLTSREMGRSVGRSVYDAKEITVNFNKKGAGATFLGAHGQTMLGDISAFVSGFGRTFYVFWNAAVQGTTNFGRAFKRSPIKAGSGALSIVEDVSGAEMEAAKMVEEFEEKG
nr:PBECR2 nuclease fold domain-containing protein [Alloprevotella sp. Lung230]